MEEFPFSEAEWDRVVQASGSIVNASLADDDVLRASCFLTLQDVLSDLRQRYGDHPVLVETEADFTDDSTEKVCLYESAIRGAVANGLPTLSIRLSYADVLVEVGRPVDAVTELMACRSELVGADEYDQKRWREIIAAAGQPEPGVGADSR